MHIGLVPLDDPSRHIETWLDLKEGSLSADGKLSDADWEVAREYVLDPKNLAEIERRRQLVRAWGLVESGRRLRADDGRTYAIEQFSPIGEQFILPFKFGGERWFVVDTYCANPDCPCNEAHLPLYRIRPELKRQDAEFAVAVDLRTGEVRQEKGEMFPPDWIDAVRAFQGSLGDWRRELSRRREALRAIAAARLRRKPAPVASAVAQEATLVKQPSTPPVRPLAPGEEPSRNAPCPCGSGKKYKRCCGAR